MPDRSLGRRNLLALAGAAPLVACAAVPDADEYLGPARTDGPTAEAGSPAILQRQYALQAVLSDSPLIAGNNIRLLRDGREALPAMFDAMRQANDHINL